jgi:hypothetical protein
LNFKRDLSSPEGALKTIVSFANTSGGSLLVGIEDGARGFKSVPDVLKEEERLANLIADNISPKLVPSIEVIAWRKTHVLGVEIYPSSNRPHHLNRLGPGEGVFVRVGSTNRRADLVLIEEMRRFSQVSSLDEQPMPELNSEAIDFRAASEFFQPIRKLTRHELGHDLNLAIIASRQSHKSGPRGICRLRFLAAKHCEKLIEFRPSPEKPSLGKRTGFFIRVDRKHRRQPGERQSVAHWTVFPVIRKQIMKKYLFLRYGHKWKAACLHGYAENDLKKILGKTFPSVIREVTGKQCLETKSAWHIRRQTCNLFET